jgi:adenylate kinase family enzyme
MRMRDEASVPPLERVVVVGTSGSGKTTFARQLASALDAPHVELDQLYWGPDWTAKPEPEFVRLADVATTAPRWVVDGNYRAVRDLLWPRATTIIWLNFGLATVFGSTLRRTLRRSLTREVLFAGNRESLRRSFLSRESILLWVLQTYWQRRRDYPVLQQSGRYAGVTWVEFRRRSDAAAFLRMVRRAASAAGVS